MFFYVNGIEDHEETAHQFYEAFSAFSTSAVKLSVLMHTNPLTWNVCICIYMLISKCMYAHIHISY